MAQQDIKYAKVIRGNETLKLFWKNVFYYAKRYECQQALRDYLGLRNLNAVGGRLNVTLYEAGEIAKILDITDMDILFERFDNND